MKSNDINLLIDAVVRQTVVLIAHLATTQGQRAPLANVANQVFLGLVQELQNQGVTQAVSADMFGMALRTYQRRKQRIMESATEQGRSLWEAVYSFLRANGSATRVEINARFAYDDENVLRGVLHDMVEAGFIARAGRGHFTRYLAVKEEDVVQGGEAEHHALETLVWGTIYHHGPVTRAQLLQSHSLDDALLDSVLESLLRDERIYQEQGQGQAVVYQCDSYLIPFGSTAGWAASVFDHYQAMVGAICRKLRQGESMARRQDQVGGSTFGFELWEGHPFEEEVLGLLAEHRDRVQKLRERVDRYNALQEEVPGDIRRVLFYLGQNVMDEREGEE